MAKKKCKQIDLIIYSILNGLLHSFECDALIVVFQFGIWNRSFICRKFGHYGKCVCVCFLFIYFLIFSFLILCLKVKVTGTLYSSHPIVCKCECACIFVKIGNVSFFGGSAGVCGGSVGHLFCNVLYAIYLYYWQNFCILSHYLHLYRIFFSSFIKMKRIQRNPENIYYI